MSRAQRTPQSTAGAAAPADGADALLDAGAVAPLGTAPGERRDTLLARDYRHPALEGRTVVRLTPATLGRAEDLTLGFLGFTGPQAPAEVGVVRRQALGFPAWALVHDPANGHHALELIKDIERFGRMAGSKPGLAKDGFDSLARRLADAVPHFLPTYYEQAARAFLAVENATYATSYFTRAREAEQSYGLAVDEDALAASFLEFALAGALSVKSLTAYARGLAERLRPAEAYERFRRICVERVAGGLPPHTSMSKDLRRLAKAAGRDTVEEIAELAGQLLPLSSMSRASIGFWNAYRPDLVRAARADARVRGLLLRLLPTVAGSAEPDEYGYWLELLEESGATAGLTEPVQSLDPAELPAEDAAHWLEQYAGAANLHWKHRVGAARERPQRDLLRLVERMADRLRAAGRPLAIAATQRGDIDLIDLCLGLGLRVADPAERNFALPVADWLAAGSGRALTAITADERFRRHLVASVAQLFRNGDVLGASAAQVAASPGLASVVAEWMDRFAAQTGEAGLADLDELLEKWLANSTPELLAVNVPAARSVAELDVAERLGYALRSGIFDEYGWPLLENLCAEFAGAQPGAVPQEAAERPLTGAYYRAYSHGGPRWHPAAQWPYLILKDGENVVVLDAEREVLAYRAAPAFTKPEHTLYRFVDGRLLIVSRQWPQSIGFYADDPLRQLEGGSVHENFYQDESLPLPGGGRTFGGEPLLSGRAEWTAQGPVAGDGTDFWTLVGPRFWNGHTVAWREFDPRTGKLGRESVPAFFEKDAPDGSVLEPRASWLVPAGTADGPLGAADGLIGFRLRVLEDGGRVCTGVDGREQLLPQVPYSWNGQGVQALLDVPGAPGRRLAVVFSDARAVHGTKVSLVAEGTRRTGVISIGAQALVYARGTWCVPQLPYWSYLTVRDEAGSAALRAMPPQLAAALLGTGGPLGREAAVEAVASLLPQVTDARLRAGVAGYVTVAGECAERLRKLRLKLALAAREPGAAEAAAAEFGAPEKPKLAWDAEFRRIRAGLAVHANNHGPLHPEDYLDVLARAFTGEPSKEDRERLAQPYAQVWHDFLDLTAILPALAVRAVSPSYPARQRGDLLDVLALAAAGPLRAPGCALRRLQLVSADGQAPPAGTLVDTGHGRVLILDAVGHRIGPDSVRNAWEWSRDGVFAPIPGWNIRTEWRSLEWPCAEPFAEFAAQARARGPLTLRPEPAARLAARSGLGELEAAVLLAGLPTRSWARHERLPAEVAATLGAKAAAVSTAGLRFEQPPAGIRHAEFVSLLLPGHVAELWESGPRLDAVAERWVAHHGLLEPIPEWLRDLAEKEYLPSAAQNLLNPRTTSAIPRQNGRVTNGALGLAVQGVLWLAYTLPVGDPLRARLPQAVARLREEVLGKGFYLVAGMIQDGGAFASRHGYSLKTAGGFGWAGPFAFQSERSWTYALFYPGLLTGPADPALQIAAANAGGQQAQDISALRILLDGTLGRLAEADAGAAERYPAQDPTRSVPDLVAEVAGAHGLSADAAALYLMLLALPDPTDRRQADWTGWKPARIKAARAELAGTDLVIGASRTRAGRSLFLPGPWHAMQSPHAPVEKWKDEALGVTEHGGLVYGAPLPRVPVAELYRAAWQRVRAGDGPRYEELAARRGR